MKQIMRAIGLMSGTSMDGIDVALIETDGEAYVKQLAHEFVAYESAFARRIDVALEDATKIENREDRPGRLAGVEVEITERHVDSLRQFMALEKLTAVNFDVIGFHGQTVLHRPDKGFTVQLGDGQALAEQTGIDVVYDMRANDMTHGGQGAPLVPIYHQALAKQLDEDARLNGVAFVNIGGISNATFVFEEQHPIALDCGPGNALIDQWMQSRANIPFDDRGRMAAEGIPDETVISRYMASPFFSLKGPKSLDRSDFTLEHVDGMEVSNGAATLAKLAAVAIAKSISDLSEVPKTVIVSGGGAQNNEMMRYLREALAASSNVVTADALGFDPDMMEAEAWAYLAVRSIKGLPLTFPTTTGCSAPVSGGVLAKAR